jgi:hypothetical protein
LCSRNFGWSTRSQCEAFACEKHARLSALRTREKGFPWGLNRTPHVAHENDNPLVLPARDWLSVSGKSSSECGTLSPRFPWSFSCTDVRRRADLENIYCPEICCPHGVVYA